MIFRNKAEKNIEEIIASLEMNMSNNYKDAAQESLQELQEKLAEYTEQGAIKKAKLQKYENVANEYSQRLQGFTHKDQKPYWT